MTMGIKFIFFLAVTLFCPVQTKTLTESPLQDPTGAVHPFNVTQNVIKEVKTCKLTEFSCNDKRRTCLPMTWRCDGDKDCLNGVDEEGCVVKTCGPTEFSCGDKRETRCLPMRWRCDGDTDCLNGADEEGCVKTCGPTEFSCNDKRRTCLPMRWRCDGDKDCLNGADEEGCETLTESSLQDPTGAVHPFNVTQNVTKEVKTCKLTEFSCNDKYKTCLPMRWRCDGDTECLNGADEEGCVVKTCRPTEFSCGDKREKCLPMRWRCDGDTDCPNGADEEGCEVKTCELTEFSCNDKRRTCLPMIQRCDGDKDCLNGADEEGCVTQAKDAPVTSKNQTEK